MKKIKKFDGANFILEDGSALIPETIIEFYNLAVEYFNQWRKDNENKINKQKR